MDPDDCLSSEIFQKTFRQTISVGKVLSEMLSEKFRQILDEQFPNEIVCRNFKN